MENAMKKIKSIVRFKDQSTLRLLFLSTITLSVYYAHYIKRQTNKINEIVEGDKKISAGFASVIMILTYVQILIAIADIFVGEPFPILIDEGYQVEPWRGIVSRTWIAMVIVWSFKARNRLNEFFEITKADDQWFHGFWTFIFQAFYFNYKVNSICENNSASQKQRKR
jgi:hypothetical protein